jgi:hypothetical protein
VNGPTAPSKQDPNARAELLKRIAALYPIVDVEAARFVAGGRLRLQRAVERDAAMRALAELEAVGAGAVIETNRANDDAILALDQFHQDEPAGSSGASVDEQMLAQLQPLDDGDAALPVPSAAPAQVVSVDDSRFRPTGDWQQPMQLELERPIAPPPPRTPSPAPPLDDGDEPAPPPAIVDEPWQPVPGRIAGGALRKQPPVRIALGVVAGLALGWMFAQPYAHRAERRVAELRAQANAERYRPVDEAQARVRELDREADDTASNGAIGMAVIWVLVGGAAFAGWWRAT